MFSGPNEVMLSMSRLGLVGAPVFQEACGALLDYTERRARARVAALAGVKGRARDALEGDGVTEDDVGVQVSLSAAARVTASGQFTLPLTDGEVPVKSSRSRLVCSIASMRRGNLRPSTAATA